MHFGCGSVSVFCRKYGFRSMLLAPLKCEGATCGLLHLTDFEPNKFATEGAVEFIETISLSIAQSLKYLVTPLPPEEAQEKARELIRNVKRYPPRAPGTEQATLQLLHDLDIAQFYSQLMSLGLDANNMKYATWKELQQLGMDGLTIQHVLRETTHRAFRSCFLAGIERRYLIGRAERVYAGVWNKNQVVALRHLPETDLRQIVRDCTTLLKLHHPNIVLVAGMTFLENELYVVTELAEGSLLDLLHTGVTDLWSPTYIAQFLGQAASAMHYLGSHNVVHRGLASNRILYTTVNGSDYVPKITDFGLSVELTHPSSGWSAYEVLAYNCCSTMSDVWSFGVIIWEIFTGGMVPFAGQAPGEVLRLLASGVRLPRPETAAASARSITSSCSHHSLISATADSSRSLSGLRQEEYMRDVPDELWLLATQCWSQQPLLRPTFVHLWTMLHAFSKHNA
eukprot:TRINITY_DN2522_c2_g1_i2.p1 TRINITY_DN2522_c2_g1~~TRINITY_DN2522_c2_g1_i2.p1  ORF type:complete len:453 (-),score=95.58 TRINITY_DN2522_c2_g1_i2:93-1451(-)